MQQDQDILSKLNKSLESKLDQYTQEIKKNDINIARKDD